MLLCGKNYCIDMYENLHSAEQICSGFSADLYEATQGPSLTTAYRGDKQLINILLLYFITFLIYILHSGIQT